MATPNYSFEKRQRELAKKRKKEEKLKAKAEQRQQEVPPGLPQEPTSADGQDPLLPR